MPVSSQAFQLSFQKHGFADTVMYVTVLHDIQKMAAARTVQVGSIVNVCALHIDITMTSIIKQSNVLCFGPPNVVAR